MLIVSKTYGRFTYELAVGGGGGGSLEAPVRGTRALVKKVT